MKLFEFLKTVSKDQNFLDQYPCVIFTGSVYPLLFFTHLAITLNKKRSGFITTYDLMDHDESQARAQLQTTFLGMQRFFWCGSIAGLEAAAQKRWRRFLDTYTGPNTILYFDEDRTDFNEKALVVALPTSIDKKLFPLICSFIGLSTSKAEGFSQALFDRVKSISFENSCLLAQYASLLGIKIDDFFDQWFDKIVISDSSLFTLSQYFFAQDTKAFFPYWAKVQHQYSEPFWISFWSEQLFRAHAFVYYMSKRKRAEANRVSYKLPFSFMQRDWKKYNLVKLKDAHDKLYNLDYQFKNGTASYGLDLFYIKFFEKTVR